MTQAQNHWIKLSKPPFNSDVDAISHVFIINKTELLIIFHDLDFALKEICIYNICNGNYTTLITEKSVNEIFVKHYTASLNDNKSFLYLFGESGKIIKLNLKTTEFETSNKSYHDGTGSVSLFINGQFHIFGGWVKKDKYHFIWNETKKK
eukprot:219318_1